LSNRTRASDASNKHPNASETVEEDQSAASEAGGDGGGSAASTENRFHARSKTDERIGRTVAHMRDRLQKQTSSV